MGRHPRITVIGVGNEFRRDDGVGWAVAARLLERAGSRALPAGTVVATCDGDPARLIGLWEGADLAVVVDAAHAEPAHPGLVHRIELDAERLAQSPATSSHGLGLGEAVELARVLGRLPGHLVVYAVEGADTSAGAGLTPAVEGVVQPLLASIQDEIARHRVARARGPS
ncbi:hydrogenase maturation protease [Streptomyces sp. WAC04114]|uniref:hydrogenase maturation protease n=1 Tax=Streptomyces sp. WAC04114 TaxID=2867961 RepID=UPI001C8BF2A6|nr:hydrogenase maturation protease [Streptomyces sp. WAC04114]MBX9360600.1 hydrogenase maturation protease [Streptomyces sp. WAC04114]